AREQDQEDREVTDERRQGYDVPAAPEEIDRAEAEDREALPSPAHGITADETKRAVREPRSQLAYAVRTALAREREHEGADHHDEDDDSDERGGPKPGVALVRRRQEGERDDREGEVRQLVPDSGHRHRKPYRPGLESPGAQHREGARHPHGGARRRDDRQRCRRLRQHEGLP